MILILSFLITDGISAQKNSFVFLDSIIRVRHQIIISLIFSIKYILSLIVREVQEYSNKVYMIYYSHNTAKTIIFCLRQALVYDTIVEEEEDI